MNNKDEEKKEISPGVPIPDNHGKKEIQRIFKILNKKEEERKK